MSDLLSCPFCGGEAGPTVKPYIGCNGSGFTVDCEKCWASTGYYDSYEEAIAAWNTRSQNGETVIERAEMLKRWWESGYREGYRDGQKSNTRAEMSQEDIAILLDELGIPERTCHIEMAEIGFTSSGESFYHSVCSECRAYIHEGDNYCYKCGARVI